ncbi:MAG: hypothetical protein MJZ05_08635 [Fibrobacter sp.]|nr:hypothetical protein [Fibrobacter sp.]
MNRKKKYILTILIGFLLGLLSAVSSVEAEYKKVKMTKALSMVVEKARWCNTLRPNSDKDINFRDVSNDWVSAIETDSSTIKIGFHKPGNTFYIKLLGYDLGPHTETYFDQYFVNVKIEGGVVLCQ